MDKVTLTKSECILVSHALDVEIMRLEDYGNKSQNRQDFEKFYRNHINALKEVNEKLKQR